MSDRSELAEAVRRTGLALSEARRAVLAGDTVGLAAALFDAATAQLDTAAILTRDVSRE